MIERRSISGLFLMCALSSFALQGCGQGIQNVANETGNSQGPSRNMPVTLPSGEHLRRDDLIVSGKQAVVRRDNPTMKRSHDTESLTPPSPPNHDADKPLRQVDKMSVNALRKFLAGKQLRPNDLVFGRDSFAADGTWHAYREGIKATFQEGMWDIRPGSDSTPELCTTEIRRDGRGLSEPQTVCRKISVSLREGRAELEFLSGPLRKYRADISKIDK